MSERETPSITPQDFEQYLQQFPAESSPVTLEEYTPENLKYAMHADALSLVVMTTLAYLQMRDSKSNPTNEQLCNLINAMQMEPLEIVLRRLEQGENIQLPQNDTEHWCVSRDAIKAVRIDLKKNKIIDPSADPRMNFSVGNSILGFWEKYKSSISPRLLLAHKNGAVNRFRTLYVINENESATLGEIESVTTGYHGGIRDNHIRPLKKAGVLSYVSKTDKAYKVLTTIPDELARKVMQSPVETRLYDLLRHSDAFSPTQYYTPRQIHKVFGGYYGTVKKVLSRLSNISNSPLFKRKNPGVEISQDYKGAIRELITLINNSIHPNRQFMKDANNTDTIQLNNPEFIRTFLLQAKDEYTGSQIGERTRRLTHEINDLSIQEVLESNLSSKKKAEIIGRYVVDGGFISRDGSVIGSPKELGLVFPNIDGYLEQKGVVFFTLDIKARNIVRMIAVGDKGILSRSPKSEGEVIFKNALTNLEKMIDNGDEITFLSGERN